MERIEFETPENVKVGYELAGLGSRFLAWFTDQLLLTVIGFIVVLGLIFGGIAVESNFGIFEDNGVPYALGIGIVIIGLGNFVYFVLCELLMRGQTVGKRQVNIRVVKANGFSLDAGSIIIRNLFRVLDHIPVMWVVPFFSGRSQRLGDMVAGTVLILDEPPKLQGLREILMARKPAERVFRFTPSSLQKLTATDYHAIEKLLERWGDLPGEQRESISATMVTGIVQRLAVDPPMPDQRRQFLEDLLSLEYQRQHRQVG